jgi:hypothetical protein
MFDIAAKSHFYVESIQTAYYMEEQKSCLDLILLTKN